MSDLSIFTPLGACAKQTVVAFLITRSGKSFVGSNQVASPQKECPRKGLPSGVGYQFCETVCHQEAHAEIAAINLALADGEDPTSARIYIHGHTWICSNCKKVLKSYKILAYIAAEAE